jgi:4-hydroxysphinganine ceramide fatty acyl 2-hydroxylase
MAADRERVIAMDEVRQHNNRDSCWIVMGGGVFDVTRFVPDHPGGEEFLIDNASTDVTELFTSDNEHEHSPTARVWLEAYRIGWLEGATRMPAPSPAPALIDLDKPVVWQIWENKLGGKYQQWVHVGQHKDKPLRFFHSDFLEFFTRTPWWAIPVVWLPVIAWMQYFCVASLRMAPQRAGLLWAVGVVCWVWLEYLLHRYLFHMHTTGDAANLAHFLLHGVHHLVPEDGYRLVFPPIATVIVGSPILAALCTLLPLGTALATFSGMLFGYGCYDVTHYYLHHGRPEANSYMAGIKSHHMDHHFKHPTDNFGITSKLLDVVFATLNEKKKFA